MRMAIVAALLATGFAAQAQDGAQTITLAEVRSRRAELAGSFIRIENVTVSGFSMARGGVVSDASGGARLDDVGMPQDTISYLERNCGQARTAASAACRGTLEFTVSGSGAQHGFVISDAEFIPQH